MKDAKCIFLEDAIDQTNDSSVSFGLDKLKDILSSILKVRKLDSLTLTLLKGETLTRWPDLLKNQKEEATIEDSSHFVEATQKLFDLNEGLQKFEGESAFSSRPVKQLFSDIDLVLNNNQLATATLAYLNSREQARQIWVVPGGQGKSRIHAAITYCFLKYTKLNVTVIFQSQGLLDIDRNLNKGMFDYAESAGMNPKGRVVYQVG